ncbi:hypothetical protein P8452_09836 [Trifolium repens]|nr:hypothetical protein P8452_09836 [Trifolium repens]
MIWPYSSVMRKQQCICSFIVELDAATELESLLLYVGFWDWFMQDFWEFEIDICKIFGIGLCRGNYCQHILHLILYCAPHYGQTNIFIYIGICYIIGSSTVISVKGIGIAIKLTLMVVRIGIPLKIVGKL